MGATPISTVVSLLRSEAFVLGCFPIKRVLLEVGFNFNISVLEHFLAGSAFISNDAKVLFSTWYFCHQASPVLLFTAKEWQWKRSMPRVIVSQHLNQKELPKLCKVKVMKNLAGKQTLIEELSRVKNWVPSQQTLHECH